MVGTLIVALRNDGGDSMGSEPLANARVAVALVPGDGSRSETRPTDRLGDGDLIQDRLEAGRVVHLSGSNLDG